MLITRATEHSIRAVLHMAAKYPAPVVSKREICQAEEITAPFLTKILQPLIAKGIVKSKRGVTGGFSLAMPPDKLTLWDVMKAIEEPISFNLCLTQENDCGRTDFCPVHEIWKDVRNYMIDSFSKKTLADLVKERTERLASLNK